MMLPNRWAAMLAAAMATAGMVGTVSAIAQMRTGSEADGLVGRATAAHASLMQGDIDGYRRAIRLADDFSLMDPFGGRPTGAPRSEAHWRRIGGLFADGRDASFELLHVYRSPHLVVLVANERAHVAIGALPAQPWSLRVTLVFRRDRGDWRLVHRHADPLVEGLTLEQAGRITLGLPASGSGA